MNLMRSNKFYFIFLSLIFLLLWTRLTWGKESNVQNITYFTPWYDPVTIEYKGKKSTLLIFKNNLKEMVSNSAQDIPSGEIYHLTNEGKSIFHVDSIYDSEIVSVFIFNDSNYSKNKTAYIVSRSKDNIRNGYYYAVTGYPIFIESNMIKVQYFSGDQKVSSIFDSCYDGIDNGKVIKCPYKDEMSVRNYLNHRMEQGK